MLTMQIIVKQCPRMNNGGGACVFPSPHHSPLLSVKFMVY